MGRLAPIDTTITLDQLTHDPYPIYKRLRAQAPVLRVAATGRTFLTKAADTKYVKETPDLFSADDPNTPMRRAFQAHTLMRKDGPEHQRERKAMAPAFAPKVVQNEWLPRYTAIAKDYVSRLPRGETVDLFPALAGPYAARGLAVILGLESATDAQMQRWSQALITGAGNFGWAAAPFAASDTANAEMNALIGSLEATYRASPDPSALSIMLNADAPIDRAQIYANIKIAIGGGINEPRDALMTLLFGLLTNPDQLAQVQKNGDWLRAFEEALRWVAPIQLASRLVTQDTELHGYLIPKGDTVMTIQASACRDEDIYDDGEVFDVYRDTKPHQAFGNGTHFCMGAHVARRAVGQIMLPMLFDRFPNLSIPKVEDVIWAGFGFRGPVQMPVHLA